MVRSHQLISGTPGIWLRYAGKALRWFPVSSIYSSVLGYCCVLDISTIVTTFVSTSVVGKPNYTKQRIYDVKVIYNYLEQVATD